MAFWEDLNKWYLGEVKTFQAIPFVQGAFAGELTRESYTRMLQDYYHFVKSAASLFGAAGARVPSDFPRVREWLLKAAYKEMGHEDFILRDLEALGIPGSETRASHPGPAMDALIGYNYYFAEHRHPAGILGTAFLMGRLSAAYSSDVAERLRKALNLGEEGTSFFFAHGHLDADQPEDIGPPIESVTNTSVQQEIQRNAKTVFMLYQNFFRTLSV